MGRNSVEYGQCWLKLARQYEARYGRTLSDLDKRNLGIRGFQKGGIVYASEGRGIDGRAMEYILHQGRSRKEARAPSRDGYRTHGSIVGNATLSTESAIYARTGTFVSNNKRYAGVPRLLENAYDEIRDIYSIPGDLNRIEISGGTFDPEIRAVGRWNKRAGIGEILFNQTLDKSDEFWADTGIHETGHIVSGYKMAKHRHDKDVMPLVPLNKYFGMGEAFPEHMRMLFSPRHLSDFVRLGEEYEPPKLITNPELLALFLLLIMQTL